ncbi:MAG: DUF389 domain-containing protein [Synechococcaceae cyanobacterium SM2_3_1]|nr:DUF389 domain-containing protein [Synechococcaceae cyanobacterium SM2_3_1]
MVELTWRHLRTLSLAWVQKIPHVPEEEVILLQDGLLRESSLRLNYLVLVTGSCVIATLGLLSNSAAVIIGAMIIAPLMLPIRGIAMGALEGNFRLFQTGLYAVGMGTGVALVISCTLGWLVTPSWGSEIMARTQPTLLDLGVALAAGGVGAFARVRAQVADSLAGVAVAVALMPPVCVMGLGLSQLDWQVSLGAGLLYLTNLLGIALSCMVTFLLLGYAPFHKARSALLGAVGLVGLLVLPLGAQLTRLLTQSQLETALETALLRGTVTFQKVELLASDFNWVPSLPEVTLLVRSTEPVTTKQVGLLEDFAYQATGQRFRLIFDVVQTQLVTSDPTLPPSPPPLATPTPAPDLSPSPEPTATALPLPLDQTPTPEIRQPEQDSTEPPAGMFQNGDVAVPEPSPSPLETTSPSRPEAPLSVPGFSPSPLEEPTSSNEEPRSPTDSAFEAEQLQPLPLSTPLIPRQQESPPTQVEIETPGEASTTNPLGNSTPPTFTAPTP